MTELMMQFRLQETVRSIEQLLHMAACACFVTPQLMVRDKNFVAACFRRMKLREHTTAIDVYVSTEVHPH